MSWAVMRRCDCGREMMPVMDGRKVLGLVGYGCAMMCDYCDCGVLLNWSDWAWRELEGVDRASWPRRIQDLIDNHPWHPNCRCPMFPQAEDPDNPA